ncbi:act minimal PKS acyl carrier protein [Nocardiopsis arvandica]|uniref:Act minimal PKS acyl carrier protein n=1 Tax=Nocardiopsis sinuspersici TaxID=501010 RepID=A0A7Z0BLA3_9ACTN|nr:acyl carrier protein [Nocardiopsis sinuspersici]NYH55653.1 act minimal PKS acyl carrier protein [Nocardiopsis sinuspersici]
MPTMDLTELMRILRDCAGQDESVDFEGDIADVSFEDLGYDSLALLQAAGMTEREHDVRLDDEAVAAATTPRELLSTINQSMAAESL